MAAGSGLRHTVPMSADEVSPDDIPAARSLRGTRLEGEDLRDLEIRDCRVDGLRIVDSIGGTVSVSGALGSVIVEDVDVGDHVRSVLDARHPGRRQVREARTPADFRAAWSLLRGRWEALLATLHEAPAGRAHASTRGEWSLAETLRHLRFVADALLGTAVLAETAPHHPWGLPPGGTPAEIIDDLELDLAATPSLAEVLEVRAARIHTLERELDALTEAELDRICDGTPGPGYPEREYVVRNCLRVLLTEEVEHLRYALRDLAVLAGEDR